MEISHMRLPTIKLMLTTFFASSLICNAELTEAKPRAVALNSPAPYFKVLSGSTVDFSWTFRVFEPKIMKAISWFYFSDTESSNRMGDEKLVQKSFTVNDSNTVGGSPFLEKDKRNRVNCTFNLRDQIWTMNCRLINAKAYDSAPYGMKIEFIDGKNLYRTNTSFLKVVDLVLDSKKSDHIVESWIGKPTVLKCAIQRKVIRTTNYKWSVVSEAKDITRGIKTGGNKTSYTFIPLSKKDFGKYKCTIWTAATTVEREIVLKQIHYAGPPEQLRVDKLDGSRSIRLFWKQPKNNGGTKIIGYEIIVRGDKRETRKSTSELSAGVTLSGDSRYIIRVCSLNKIGRLESSCATADEVNIAKSAQKGHQNKLKVDLLHILAALFLVFRVI